MITGYDAGVAIKIIRLRDRDGSDGAEKGCSFCGKPRHEVARLFGGPGVYICDECVNRCNALMDDDIEPIA